MDRNSRSRGLWGDSIARRIFAALEHRQQGSQPPRARAGTALPEQHQQAAAAIQRAIDATPFELESLKDVAGLGVATALRSATASTLSQVSPAACSAAVSTLLLGSLEGVLIGIAARARSACTSARSFLVIAAYEYELV